MIIFKQIVEGIHYMHKKKIIHRDIKLENILVKNKEDINSINIADFGLSKFVNTNDDSKFFVGTPGYIPPEMFLDSLP